MNKSLKPSPEFENFTAFMDKLAKVPNGEVKAALETEKRLKKRAKSVGDTPTTPPDSSLDRGKGRHVKRIQSSLGVVLVILLLSAVSHAAKHQVVWQSAKLISFDAKQGTDSGSAQTTGHVNSDGTYSGTTTESDWSYVDYRVTLDDGKMLYFGTWRLVFRWQKDPHFTENEMVKYDLDGDKLTVIDDKGKEIKMKLIKRRIKE